MERRLAALRDSVRRAETGAGYLGSVSSSGDRRASARLPPREKLPLHLEFREQPLVDMASAVRHHRRQQPRLGVARIVPAWISGNRVPAEAADIGAAVHRIAHLVADIVKPRRLARALRAGFGEEHRIAI